MCILLVNLIHKIIIDFKKQNTYLVQGESKWPPTSCWVGTTLFVIHNDTSQQLF